MYFLNLNFFLLTFFTLEPQYFTCFLACILGEIIIKSNVHLFLFIQEVSIGSCSGLDTRQDPHYMRWTEQARHWHSCIVICVLTDYSLTLMMLMSRKPRYFIDMESFINWKKSESQRRILKILFGIAQIFNLNESTKDKYPNHILVLFVTFFPNTRQLTSMNLSCT